MKAEKKRYYRFPEGYGAEWRADDLASRAIYADQCGSITCLNQPDADWLTNRQARSARLGCSSPVYPPYFMTFACCRSGSVHFCVSIHRLSSERNGRIQDWVICLETSIVSLVTSIPPLFYLNIISCQSSTMLNLVVSYGSYGAKRTTCDPQSMCIETDERGSDREQHASCRMKLARAQAICPLVRRLPWSNLGRLPVIVNVVIGEGFCRRHMPRIAVTSLPKAIAPSEFDPNKDNQLQIIKRSICESAQ